jgi:hypothetical protein
VQEIHSTLAPLFGVHGIAQELWVFLDLPGTIVSLVDKVPGVFIILDELVQLQAKLLDIAVNQPRAETDIMWSLSLFLLVP